MNQIKLSNILDTKQFEINIKLDKKIEEIFLTKLEGNCKSIIDIKKKEDNSVKINLKIEQLLVFTCFKCLDLVKFHLVINVEEELEEDSEFISQDNLNIEEIINQQVFLNMPSRVVCKEDCKGLCPTCGVNKNLKTCSCKNEQVNEENPFKKLEELIF